MHWTFIYSEFIDYFGMLEYVQFRIGGISFYRAIVDEEERTVIRKNDIGRDRLEAIQPIWINAQVGEDKYLPVLKLEQTVVINGTEYLSMEPITIYEPTGSIGEP